VTVSQLDNNNVMKLFLLVAIGNKLDVNLVHQYFSILVSMGFSTAATCRNQRKPRNLETWKPMSNFLETSQYGEQQKPQKPMETYRNYGN